MIQIMPTTESGLSHSTYRLDLPAELNPVRPRSQKITTTIDGGAAITLWPKNIKGAQQTVRVVISETKNRVLELIVNHQTVFEWLVFCDGRRYTCAIDSTIPISLGSDSKQLDVIFTVIE